MDELALLVSLLAGKAREQSKRNGGVPQTTGGRAPLLGPPETNCLLYHVVVMKAAGLKLGGPCSLFAEARRLKFS